MSVKLPLSKDGQRGENLRLNEKSMFNNTGSKRIGGSRGKRNASAETCGGQTWKFRTNFRTPFSPSAQQSTSMQQITQVMPQTIPPYSRSEPQTARHHSRPTSATLQLGSVCLTEFC